MNQHPLYALNVRSGRPELRVNGKGIFWGTECKMFTLPPLIE